MNQEELIAKREEFAKLTAPLIEWLNNNSNPHSRIIIESDSAELLSGELSFVTEDYLVD